MFISGGSGFPIINAFKQMPHNYSLRMWGVERPPLFHLSSIPPSSFSMMLSSHSHFGFPMETCLLFDSASLGADADLVIGREAKRDHHGFFLILFRLNLRKTLGCRVEDFRLSGHTSCIWISFSTYRLRIIRRGRAQKISRVVKILCVIL